MSIELDYLTLSRMGVAIGATTPVPSGGPGSIIWSNTVGDVLKWNGSAWVSNVGIGTLAAQNASSVQIVNLQVDGTLTSTGAMSSPSSLSLTGNTSASGVFFGPEGAVHKIYSDGSTTLRYRYNATTEYDMIHSGNISSYAPTTSGTGASGTWGISITGNAATATNATYATSAGSASTAGSATTAGAATTAGNVTGVVAVANGGTGVSTIADVKTALAVNNVNNTSDVDKPVSSAQQTALDLKLDRTGGTITGVSSTHVDNGTISSGTVTLNFALGDSHRLQIGGAITIAVSNWPASGKRAYLLVELVNGGAFTVTLPNINWIKPDGIPTTTFSTYLTSIGRSSMQSSGTDFIVWWSRDGGTTVYGKLV